MSKKPAPPTYVRDDSSEDEALPVDAPPPQPQAKREAAFLDKDAVLAAVLSIGQPSRLPSVMTDEVREAWSEWHKSTPTSLEEMPIERRASYKFAMPMKCRPAGALVQAAPEARAQVELIAYRNQDIVDGERQGAGISKVAVQRNAELQLGSHILPADVPKNSTVAFRNAALEEQTAAELESGEGTPFLLGDVLDYELEQAAGSSSDTAFVSRVLLHYRMPYAGETPSNNPTKPWHKSCLCRQKYSLAHERFRLCKELRAKAVGSTSYERETNAYVDWQSAAAIFETQVSLNQSQSLKAESKKRLGERNAAWLPLLGVDAAAKATKGASKPGSKRSRGS